MIVAIHQPNFLPWCGFFAKMAAADVFILLDDAQISKPSYVTRTSIRTGGQAKWLTLPANTAGAPPIREVTFAREASSDNHLKRFSQDYAKAPAFAEIMPQLEEAYDDLGETVCDFNIRLLEMARRCLGVSTPMVRASDFALADVGGDRLIKLVKAVGGTTYLSGKGGENYQDPAKFDAAGIALDVRAYSPVPYEAGRFDFIPGLSIIDALFVKGADARALLSYP